MGADQEEVIAFLERPASYGAEVREVERIDTHAAIVFLAGTRAYKLKRAVRYSYLDYGSVARREHFCRAEMALNRRTAPDLYLAVTPVVRRPRGGLALGGEGEPVDWVVVMRRFDQEQLLDRLAAAGRLDAALMRELADRIAAFHEGAERDHAFGGAEGIAVEIASNDENLRIAAPALFDPAAVRRLHRESQAALDHLRPLLEHRRQKGDVRVCHGDLHLRNICLLDGQPTLFDCIEFSPRMIRIDVLYDLAFLLMDLEHRRLRPLGNVVMNRYLDRTSQADGLAALPLFLSVRAAIRAHVGAAASRAQTAPEARERSEAEARAYLEEALAFLAPPPPRLLAVGGLSGTGKSTLAQALAPGLGAAPGARLLRSDVIRKRLLGRAPEEPLPDSAYGSEVTDRVYGALIEEAARSLAAGHSVIADAVCARPEQRRALASAARAEGAPFAGLWLEAPPEILMARVEGRSRDASDATVATVRQQLGYRTGPIDWRRLDVSGDPGAVAAEAAAVLARPDAWRA